MKEYLEDKKGFYNVQQFKQTGLKFRPLQLLEDQVVVDNSELAAARARNRENTRRIHPGYRSPRK